MDKLASSRSLKKPFGVHLALSLVAALVFLCLMLFA